MNDFIQKYPSLTFWESVLKKTHMKYMDWDYIGNIFIDVQWLVLYFQSDSIIEIKDGA